MKQERVDIKEFKRALGESCQERDILRQICKYLQAKGYWFTRLQNVGVWDEKVKARRKNWYMRKGLPDIICFKGYSETVFGGRRYILIAIEVKNENGRVTPEQKDFRMLTNL